MALRANRRLLGLLVALLFANGSVAQAYAATASMVQAPTSAIEQSMPDHGDDCGGKDKAAHRACLAMCASAVGILSEPSIVVPVAAINDIRSASEAVLAGHSLRPEPPPPKG